MVSRHRLRGLMQRKQNQIDERKASVGTTPTRKLWYYYLPRWQMVRARVEMSHKGFRVVFETQEGTYVDSR